MSQSLIKLDMLHFYFLHKLIRIYIINFISLKTMSVVNSRKAIHYTNSDFQIFKSSSFV